MTAEQTPRGDLTLPDSPNDGGASPERSSETGRATATLVPLSAQHSTGVLSVVKCTLAALSGRRWLAGVEARRDGVARPWQRARRWPCSPRRTPREVGPCTASSLFARSVPVYPCQAVYPGGTWTPVELSLEAARQRASGPAPRRHPHARARRRGGRVTGVCAGLAELLRRRRLPLLHRADAQGMAQYKVSHHPPNSVPVLATSSTA